MTKHSIYNLVILDESGSMQSIKTPTISGFNELVQTVKGLEKQFTEQEHFISFITFNSLGIKTKLDRAPVAGIEPINENNYQPDSMTPLYDAIGISVLYLKNNIPQNNDYHVLVTILTDGEENDSREFNGGQVKKLIENLKKSGWTFTYIGANQDVEKAGLQLSISNTLHFSASAAGVSTLFENEKAARFRMSEKIRNKEDVGDGFYGEGSKT